MMSPLGFSSTFSLSAWLLHGVGLTLWFGGAALLAAWAIRSLSPERLRLVGVWLLALGAVACLVAVVSWSYPFGVGGMRSLNSPASTRDIRAATPTYFAPTGDGVAPADDGSTARPDHLMPDGSMMDSRSMQRMMGGTSSASAAPTSSIGSDSQ